MVGSVVQCRVYLQYSTVCILDAVVQFYRVYVVLYSVGCTYNTAQYVPWVLLYSSIVSL